MILEKLELFWYRLENLFFYQIYDALCLTRDGNEALITFIADMVIFLAYIPVGILLVMVILPFLRKLPTIGKVLRTYGLFIAFCGVTHITGWLAELGGFWWLNTFVTIITAYYSLRALTLTFMYRKALMAWLESLWTTASNHRS